MGNVQTQTQLMDVWNCMFDSYLALNIQELYQSPRVLPEKAPGKNDGTQNKTIWMRHSTYEDVGCYMLSDGFSF